MCRTRLGLENYCFVNLLGQSPRKFISASSLKVWVVNMLSGDLIKQQLDSDESLNLLSRSQRGQAKEESVMKVGAVYSDSLGRTPPIFACRYMKKEGRKK
jgi:hypothetical protein